MANPALGAKNYIKGTYIKEGIAESAPVFKELPFEEASDFSEVVTYEDKVALISYRENFLGVIIESKEINQMQRAAFELMWSALEAGE